jgi:RNAse (barnase) inhibitor barstar
MREIDLDAKNWKTVSDFYAALLPELGAPEWHGENVNALIDSMIWGGINEIEPPYRIVIRNAGHLPKDVATEIDWTKEDLAKHRAHYRAQKGHDIIVEFEIIE